MPTCGGYSDHTRGVFALKTKECRRCFQVKPVSEFHRCSRLADGLQTWCKSCINEYKREQRETRRTPEQQVELDRLAENRELYKSGLRRCKFCHKVKPLDAYHRAPENGPTELYSSCSECRQDRYGKSKRSESSPRTKAMKAIYDAVHRGDINRPCTCPVCGRTPKKRRAERIQFHHTDGYYGDKKFFGVFLCARCHNKVHQGLLEVSGHDYTPKSK